MQQSGVDILPIFEIVKAMETVNLAKKIFVYSQPYGSEYLPNTLHPFYIVCIKPFEFKNKRLTKGLTDKSYAPGR